MVPAPPPPSLCLSVSLSASFCQSSCNVGQVAQMEVNSTLCPILQSGKPGPYEGIALDIPYPSRAHDQSHKQTLDKLKM